MPIPSPHDGESEKDFVGRCMSDDAMRQEYEQDQRAAICYRSFQKAASMIGQLRVFGSIEKVEALQDGTIKVHGVASTETMDDQGEIVRAAAMRAAIPDYMRFGNIREMHGLSAAGRALNMDCGDDNITRIVAHVVDPVAVKKVQNRVYNGFSIGGRVTSREAGSANIIDGVSLNEISLVDRPANPGAIFEVWKASGDKAMPDGLGTLGDALAAAIAKAAPTQKWDCGDPAHTHVKKDDAAKCMVFKAAEKPKEPDADESGGKSDADEDDAKKADAKPSENKKDEQNTDGDNDSDDGNPKGDGNKDDIDEDHDSKKASDGDKPYGDVTYADPGYQSDGKKRYPIDTEEHVRAALSYINQAKNGGKYSSEQLSSIKSKIHAAAKRHGIETSDKAAGNYEWLKGALEALMFLEKAGNAHSAADRGLMNVAHDAINKLTDGSCCGIDKGAEANATQDTGRNASTGAHNVSPPSETYNHQNATQDTSKAGRRHSSSTHGNLQTAHDHLVKAGAMCSGQKETASTVEGARAMGEGTDLAPGVGTLLKAFETQTAENGELKKTVTGIVEMVTELKKTVESIAKQPIPGQAAIAIPDGVAAISKAQDGQSSDHMALATQGPSKEEIAKYWQEMSPQEKFAAQYAVSRMQPIMGQPR